MRTLLRGICFVVVASIAAAAHADLVPPGDLGIIAAPATVSFANPSVSVGTTTTQGAITYNFLDRWMFTLSTNANVAALTAAINFVAGPNGPVIFGISNLQINLTTNPASGPPLVSWLTVTTPASGLQQLVALVPTSPLGAGNYFLDVRGTLSAPGSYSGSLIADAPSPVPLPAAFPLFAIGAGMLAARMSRRRKSASA